MSLLSGKVAVVTGGAQGLGLAIAERFVDEGAVVVVFDLDEGAVEEVAHRLTLRGAEGMGIGVHRGAVSLGLGCDVTNSEAVASSIEQTMTQFGHVDVFVNNAGITRDSTIRKMTEDDFRAVLDVHLVGAWLCTKHVAPHMRAQGAGSIINISSISGKVGNIGQTNYSAAKAGLVGLTKASAKEFARDGVRVNAIQPGLIDTPMTRAMPEAIWDQKLAEIPLARAGEPSEVAASALFLASELSSYITGAVLEITGGRYM